MNETKLLGGTMSKNKAMGFTWLSSLLGPAGWALALAILLTDKDHLDLEDQRSLISIFVCSMAQTVAVMLSFLFIPLLVIPYTLVCSIIACVFAFKGKNFKIPGIYQLVSVFVK